MLRICLRSACSDNILQSFRTIPAQRNSLLSIIKPSSHRLNWRNLYASNVYLSNKKDPPSKCTSEETEISSLPKKKLAVRFVDRFPSGVQPYLRVARVDRPIGNYLVLKVELPYEMSSK